MDACLGRWDERLDDGRTDRHTDIQTNMLCILQLGFLSEQLTQITRYSSRIPD